MSATTARTAVATLRYLPAPPRPEGARSAVVATIEREDEITAVEVRHDYGRWWGLLLGGEALNDLYGTYPEAVVAARLAARDHAHLWLVDDLEEAS